MTHDEALTLMEEASARPCWKADGPYPHQGAYRITVTYTPKGYLTFWARENVVNRRQWERICAAEERKAQERASAAMKCNFAVEYWVEEQIFPAGVQEGHWVTFAFVEARQYGGMIGGWLHTQSFGMEGRKVRLVEIHGLHEYGTITDVWPNMIDCDTRDWPCKHTKQ